MSTPDTARHTWTRVELEALRRPEVVKTAKVCLLPPLLTLSYAQRGLPLYIASPTLVDDFSFIYRI